MWLNYKYTRWPRVQAKLGTKFRRKGTSQHVEQGYQPNSTACKLFLTTLTYVPHGALGQKTNRITQHTEWQQYIRYWFH
jgi:hypothetical protein